jgi:hypothetical protein
MKRNRFTEEQIIGVLHEQGGRDEGGGGLLQTRHIGADVLVISRVRVYGEIGSGRRRRRTARGSGTTM